MSNGKLFHRMSEESLEKCLGLTRQMRTLAEEALGYINSNSDTIPNCERECRHFVRERDRNIRDERIIEHHLRRAPHRARKRASGFLPTHRTLGKYGITPDEFHAMREAQGNACAICREHFTVKGSVAIDHDHDTGPVRGLLCPFCNKALGLFYHSIPFLEAAIAYLNQKGGAQE